VYYASYPGNKRPTSYWWTICKTKAHHIMDAPVVDKAYREEVDGTNELIISLVVDLGNLKHESSMNKLLNDQDEAQIGDENSPTNEDEDENEGEWDTNSDTSIDEEEYILENDSSN
jgi:hypothetical protein